MNRLAQFLHYAQKVFALKTRRRRWRHLCGLKDPVGDDLFGYVAERLYLEDLRPQLVATAKTLKQNKALESCKINGLLFFESGRQ